jgi:hypothetical protein
MGLSSAARQILAAMQQGATLKAHRTLDGAKLHQLHPLQGAAFVVPTAAVRELEERGWLRSNMKFPAATYLLTEQGSQVTLQPPARWFRWCNFSR